MSSCLDYIGILNDENRNKAITKGVYVPQFGNSCSRVRIDIEFSDIIDELLLTNPMIVIVFRKEILFGQLHISLFPQRLVQGDSYKL